MKITSFNPMIASKNAEDVIKVFEALGFEKTHRKGNIEDTDITTVRMKDSNGFHVDVVSTELVKDKDLALIRMNVDDFDEAYELLKSKGFKNIQGEKVTDTGSSLATLMRSPSGFVIDLVKHIKK